MAKKIQGGDLERELFMSQGKKIASESMARTAFEKAFSGNNRGWNRRG